MLCTSILESGVEEADRMAVKRITQETFDDAVKENMDDFGASREDAIKDTIEEFEMQVRGGAGAGRGWVC